MMKKVAGGLGRVQTPRYAPLPYALNPQTGVVCHMVNKNTIGKFHKVSTILKAVRFFPHAHTAVFTGLHGGGSPTTPHVLNQVGRQCVLKNKR